MTTFFILLGIICGILDAILFWKIWYMCNNVAKITNKLCGNAENTNITKTICESVATIETPAPATETPLKTNSTYTGNLKIGDTVNVIGSNLNGQVISLISNDSIGVEINGKTVFYENSEIAKI